ncbi:MAG TPA: acyl-CoA dehydrogenase family protein [Burkholderiales bacterium]|nr:acyl-CoA dehydrogenase family protein [Burkholderiales bacterium]
MEFHFDPEDEAFRQEVRAFIKAKLDPELAERMAKGFYPTRTEMAWWMGVLAEKGWVAPHWPVEHGGPGWSPLRRLIFEEECILADAPPRKLGNLVNIGPILYTYGTPEQKRRYLRGTMTGEIFWCQGFSEPNAGSDLASLRTRAVRDGDHYVVTGQKIWTSGAHESDMMYALVRTGSEGRPQAGITFLLLDMKSPGVTVRPLITINESHMVNEVFLDGVRVPVENRVGEEGKGWGLAGSLLAGERAFSADLPQTMRDMKELKRVAARERKGARPIIENPLFRAKLARLEVNIHALHFAMLRVLSANDEHELSAVAIIKLRGSELRQQVAELLVEALGDYGLAFYPDPFMPGYQDEPVPPGPEYASGAANNFLFRRAFTIVGGSNEIQRDIIAKRVLSL